MGSSKCFLAQTWSLQQHRVPSHWLSTTLHVPHYAFVCDLKWFLLAPFIIPYKAGLNIDKGTSCKVIYNSRTWIVEGCYSHCAAQPGAAQHIEKYYIYIYIYLHILRLVLHICFTAVLSCPKKKVSKISIRTYNLNSVLFKQE